MPSRWRFQIMEHSNSVTAPSIDMCTLAMVASFHDASRKIDSYEANADALDLKFFLLCSIGRISFGPDGPCCTQQCAPASRTYSISCWNAGHLVGAPLALSSKILSVSSDLNYSNCRVKFESTELILTFSTICSFVLVCLVRVLNPHLYWKGSVSTKC